MLMFFSKAHRITIGTIHSDVNYLPSPCYGLTDHTILAIMDEFRGILRLVGVSAPPEDIFMRCPSFDGRVYIYNDVSVREFEVCHFLQSSSVSY
jgi:hypothetical protein